MSLTYATHNIYVGNRRPTRNVARMIRATGNPVGVALQEASRWSGEDVAGYQVYRADDDPNPEYHTEVTGQDAFSSIVLLRDDATVVKVEARQVPDGEWTWNKPRVGRIWLRVVYDLDGVRRELWSVHRCPGGPRPGIKANRAAWKAEHEFLVEWVERVLSYNPDRHIEIGGDHNAWKTKLPGHPHSIVNLARRLGAKVNMRHIDGFLSINAPESAVVPGSRRPAVVEVLVAAVRKLAEKFGSDGHRPVVLTYGPRARRRRKR